MTFFTAFLLSISFVAEHLSLLKKRDFLFLLREAEKKVFFSVAQPIRPYPPRAQWPHFLSVFFEFKKGSFIFVTTTFPPLVVTFFAAFRNQRVETMWREGGTVSLSPGLHAANIRTRFFPEGRIRIFISEDGAGFSRRSNPNPQPW